MNGVSFLKGIVKGGGSLLGSDALGLVADATGYGPALQAVRSAVMKVEAFWQAKGVTGNGAQKAVDAAQVFDSTYIDIVNSYLATKGKKLVYDVVKRDAAIKLQADLENAMAEFHASLHEVDL